MEKATQEKQFCPVCHYEICPQCKEGNLKRVKSENGTRELKCLNCNIVVRPLKSS